MLSYQDFENLSYQYFEKLGLSDLFLNIWSYGAEQKNDQVILKYLHWNIDLAKKKKKKKKMA